MASSEKHIFLTGNIQVGKSTIIKSIIDSCPQKNIGGFFTRWINKSKINDAGLYIFPCEKKAINAFWDRDKVSEDSTLSHFISKGNLIASFDSGNYKSKIIYKEVFDKLGKKYLKAAKNSDLIIIDEVGIMEDKSYEFKEELLKLLDGDIPILGVVRNKSGVITDAVKNHSNVKIIEVTRENRDILKKNLLKIIR